MQNKKNKTKKISKKYKVSTKKINNIQVDYLEYLIKVTEKQIDGKWQGLDELFTNQANRLRKQLEIAKNAK